MLKSSGRLLEYPCSFSSDHPGGGCLPEYMITILQTTTTLCKKSDLVRSKTATVYQLHCVKLGIISPDNIIFIPIYYNS